ncbi:TcmI family type II polyketide cyclase [Streptomyces sp. NPDC057580]|uniref:TcmI family type II polyketide cyclase n=1 Tax=Streptomyces sp. NPDC057580 TaxID=3346173 RepID=UPI00369CEECB
MSNRASERLSRRGTLIVAHMVSGAGTDVARLFAEFHATNMPHRMGTRRRQSKVRARVRQLAHDPALFAGLQVIGDFRGALVLAEADRVGGARAGQVAGRWFACPASAVARATPGEA